MVLEKDKIKNSLSLDQIEELLNYFGAEPKRQNNFLICRTICHGGHSHKLYYYDNSKLFRCYTECEPAIFDIFELIIKIKKQHNETITLYNAMVFIINFFSLNFEGFFSNGQQELQDWNILSKWEKNNNKNEYKKIIELKFYNDNFLKNFPRPHIIPWEKEGIKKQICDNHNICYNPLTHGVIIPHYNIDNKLIGIRERTLVKENELYGKYKPAIINGYMYNHPLGYNLYNINNSKRNIRRIKKAILFEGEKSCLLFSSFFGDDNDCSVAVCGSNLFDYQVNLLLSLKIEEFIIAFDRQYQEIGDKEYQLWTKKLLDFHNKYGQYAQISYILDKEHYLKYKDSPIDQGKDIFLKLYKERIVL